MPIYESIFILVVAALIWFWLDSLKAREIGVRAAQVACAGEGLQFLDDSVVGRLLGVARNDDGHLCLRRSFAFEYSDTGDNRRHGSVILLGHDIELLHVRPNLYEIPKSNETRH